MLMFKQKVNMFELADIWGWSTSFQKKMLLVHWCFLRTHLGDGASAQSVRVCSAQQLPEALRLQTTNTRELHHKQEHCH